MTQPIPDNATIDQIERADARGCPVADIMDIDRIGPENLTSDYLRLIVSEPYILTGTKNPYGFAWERSDRIAERSRKLGILYGILVFLAIFILIQLAAYWITGFFPDQVRTTLYSATVIRLVYQVALIYSIVRLYRKICPKRWIDELVSVR